MTRSRPPALDVARCVNYSPHVVILGAGATRACIPRGDSDGRVAPVMLDFVTTLRLQPLFARAGIDWQGRNFEDLYHTLHGSGHRDLEREIEQRVWDYFSAFHLPPGPTVYDYLLLSLRPKDLIATFNWDPLLLQAYRRHAVLRELPRVVFLHGNVAIGICRKCRVKGLHGDNCSNCGGRLECTPLLYPVRDKDYTSDAFIHAEWEELRGDLGNAYFLTIFGYGAPAADVAAISLMRDVWDNNPTKTLAEIEIIDIKPKEDLLTTWGSFITREHYITPKTFERGYLHWHPRRSCEALAFATLQNDPWPDNYFPEFTTLADLQAWAQPLIDEEVALAKDNLPLTRHGGPCLGQHSRRFTNP